MGTAVDLQPPEDKKTELTSKALTPSSLNNATLHRIPESFEDTADSDIIYPAIVSECPVFPGHVKSIEVRWEQQARAVDQAAASHTSKLVVLPIGNSTALDEIKVATLVELKSRKPARDFSPELILVSGLEVVNVHVTGQHPHLHVACTSQTLSDSNASISLAVESLSRAVERRASLLLADDDDPYKDLSSDELTFELAREYLNAGQQYLVLAALTRWERLLLVDAELSHQLDQAQADDEQSDAPLGREDFDDDATQRFASLPLVVRQGLLEERSRSLRGGEDDHAKRAENFVLGMKWLLPEPPPIDLKQARIQLDSQYLGLDTVKEAVLDLLATWEWSRKHQSAIAPTGKVICLVGPPGVGKTSIASAVASVLHRTLIQVPMGGADAVFLAGSDQSYKHARPGEIARRIRQSQRHPGELVFLLDEIDKVPHQAEHGALPVLLSLLDRLQHSNWRDHFIDAVPIDLSQAIFICTANDLTELSPPLLDRLQPLVLPAYTRPEQIDIGRHWLLPRLQSRLLITDQVQLADDVIDSLVTRSAQSPGVRQLQAQLETILSRGLRLHLESGTTIRITASDALLWTANGTAPRRIGFVALSSAGHFSNLRPTT